MNKLLTIITVFIFISTSFADTTYVSGTIVGETWTTAGSPYIVVGNILVADLIIQPGVEICFSDNFVFEVSGILSAIGTVQDSIYFKRSLTNTIGWQGIYFNLSAPGSELAYCRIEGSKNRGIRIENSNTNVFPDISNCTITNNSDSQTGGGGLGGGIYVNGEAVFNDCLISNNSISRSGNNISSRGGGVYANGTLTLINTIVKGNTVSTNTGTIYAVVSSYGGGIYVNGESRLYNCIIDSNSTIASDNNEGGGSVTALGGGLYLNGHFVLTNSIISNNIAQAIPFFQTSALDQGGGLYGDSSDSSTIVNCTIAYNEDEGIRSAGDTVDIVNSIIFFTTPGTSEIFGPVNVNYCDVEGGYPGIGNINFNPILISDTNYYLRINQNSLCVDAGDTGSIYDDVCFPPSWGTERNDIGAHGGPGACGWLNSIIPVELESFTSTFINGNVKLNWSTATEINNRGFEIQRKKGNDRYQKLDFVSGYSTSTETHEYSYNDKPANSGKYYYRLKQVDFDGTFSYSKVVEVEYRIPNKYSLSQNFPNPFNPTTKITFSIRKSGFVSLKVYDILGREVATLVNEQKRTGKYEVKFDASNLPSGIYFYRLQADSFTQAKKMILLR